MSEYATEQLARRLVLFFALVAIASGVLLAYRWQLVDTYDYKGYRHIEVNWRYAAGALVALALLAVMMPLRVRRPSDFFVFFHLLLVFFPYAILYSIRGPVSWGAFLAVSGVLLLPVLLVMAVVRLMPGIRPPALLPQSVVLLLLVVLCVMGAAIVVALAPASAGFDLNYDRRLEGREVFGSGSPLAYLNSIVANGLTPFLAFLAGCLQKRRVFYLAVAVACEVAYYYSLGLKSPLLFIVMAFALGSMVRKGRMERMPSVILAAIGFALLVFLAEYLARGMSFIAELLIRRALTEPPFLVSAYAEFAMTNPEVQWSAWSGVDIPGDITFFVGENYLGVAGSNANTNTFLDRLAAGGIPAYVATMALVACVFAVLDGLHRSVQSPALIYVGFSFSLLLVEQSATVALVSSGIGALLMIVALMGPGRRVPGPA